MTPTRKSESEFDPTHHGGAYKDGKRTEGPEPDYGFVVNTQGKRVPAGPDGKPRSVKEASDA